MRERARMIRYFERLPKLRNCNFKKMDFDPLNPETLK